MSASQQISTERLKSTPTEEWIGRWQNLAPSHPQRRLLLEAITARAQRWLRTILTRRLPATALSQQDLPDLIHRALELMLQKLADFDAQRGDFQTWLFYFCGQPVLGEYLRGLNYRSVKLGHYHKLLNTPKSGIPASPVRELVQGMNAQEIAWEQQRVTQLLEKGRKCINVRYGPQMISLSVLEEGGIALSSPQEDHDTNERLWKAIKKLPPREYAVVIGVFFEGQAQNQLAAQMQVSTVRIHQLKKRALCRLALILGKDFLS